MDLEKLSDEQVVVIVREGGQENYREIIRRYQKRLTHYLRKFIVNPDELEDVLQDVFIKTFRNLHDFNEHKKFSSWIYRIAHNEAINSIKKKSNQNLNIDDFEYKIFDEKLNIEHKVDQKIFREKILLALNNLKIKYRDPLILFFFEELSYDEISDVLKIPTSTVGTLIRRGKDKLKQELLNLDKND